MSDKNKIQEFLQKQGLPLPIYTYTRCGGEDHKPEWNCQIECRFSLEKDSEKEIFTSSTWNSKKKASEEAAKLALEYIDTSDFKISKDYLDNESKIFVNKELSLGASFKNELPLVSLDKEGYCSFEGNNTIIILLDLENAPNSYENLCNKMALKLMDENYVIIGFYSKNSYHIYMKVYEQIKVYNIPVYFYKAHSSYKDSADIRMIMFVGELLGIIRYNICENSMTVSNIPAENNGVIFIKRHSIPNIKLFIITNDHFGEALGDLINNYYYNTPEIMNIKAEVYHSVSEMI